MQHTDIEGFLKNEHENAILSVIAEQKLKTFDEVTERHWETRHVEWDHEKTRILSTLLGADERLNIGKYVYMNLLFIINDVKYREVNSKDLLGTSVPIISPTFL